MITWIKKVLNISNQDKTLNTSEFESSLIPEVVVEEPKAQLPKTRKASKPKTQTEKPAPKKRGRPKKNVDSAV